MGAFDLAPSAEQGVRLVEHQDRTAPTLSRSPFLGTL
jgi:hypothetical protein